MGEPLGERSAEAGSPAQDLGPGARQGRRIVVLGPATVGGLEREPEEAVRGERHVVRQLTDGRESRLAERLHRHRTLEAAQVELDVLGQTGQVRHAEERWLGTLAAAVLAEEREHVRVLRLEEPDRPAS